jgi:predicted nucleic acid-binding protein
VLRGLALLPVDGRTARIAAVLRGLYGLRTSDAVHLATAINSGADRFVTGNRRDFSRVREIELLHP